MNKRAICYRCKRKRFLKFLKPLRHRTNRIYQGWYCDKNQVNCLP